MAKGCSNNTYEEARKQRLEENKKRFEVSIDIQPLQKRSRSKSSAWGSYGTLSYIARPVDEIKEATEEERLCALQAAEALQINLNSSNPSFIKSMGLPPKFCEEHLPRTVYNMVLEDENGSEYEAIYIGNRNGISGGWRAFALDHRLDDGDALVFELIEASRFKIYIVRAFPDSVEEKGMDIFEEEGNMHDTEALKAACNSESESKTKKPKHVAVYEIKESEFSQENLPDGLNPTEKSKS
ncbi:hypothetical protein Fmac_031226 [Flemingia macrophylla]|uniref:TF-B3 domain-containing protein n=1 Tax=Flemingia macrophylla TaxID=520843 RepID=A0ABD1L1H4_9FABA